MRLACFVLAALAVAPLAARADDDAKLPFKPYEKVQKGDWCALAGEWRSGDERHRAGALIRAMYVEKKRVSLDRTLKIGKKDAEKKTVGTREFACKKMTFEVENHGTQVHVKQWLTEESPGGVVKIEAHVNDHGRELSLDVELGGFGSKESTTWGETAEDLAKKDTKKEGK